MDLICSDRENSWLPCEFPPPDGRPGPCPFTYIDPAAYTKHKQNIHGHAKRGQLPRNAACTNSNVPKCTVNFKFIEVSPAACDHILAGHVTAEANSNINAGPEPLTWITEHDVPSSTAASIDDVESISDSDSRKPAERGPNTGFTRCYRLVPGKTLCINVRTGRILPGDTFSVETSPDLAVSTPSLVANSSLRAPSGATMTVLNTGSLSADTEL